MIKRTKALHILSSFGYGGAELWMLELAKYLTVENQMNNQLEIEFLLTSGKIDALDSEFERLGYKLHYITFSFSGYLKFIINFRKLLNKGEYDVVHSHQDFVSGWFYLAGVGLLPRKLVSYLHNPIQTLDNYRSSCRRYFAYYLGKWLTFFFTSNITGTSDQVLNDYGYDKFPYSKKRVPVVHCGINPEKFRIDKKSSRNRFRKELGLSPDSEIILFVGRLEVDSTSRKMVNQKNPEFAFEIALRMALHNKNLCFVFVGKGELVANEMRESILDNNLENRIFLLGTRMDVPYIMAASDILLFPSKFEALGMVAVEAQSVGLLTIMSDGVPKEAIINDQLVVTLSAKDDVEKWIYVINTVLGNKNYSRLDLDPVDYLCKSNFSIMNSTRNLLDLYQRF